MNALWSAFAIEELIRLGVDYFCISPGSRSAPLTLAAAEHPKTQTQICLDERGAAFHALGYARATGQPAALICTSGTALANYYPAVIEASMDCVPMLLLTADRPPELREAGANQAIRQAGLYGDCLRWFVDLPCPTEAISAPTLLTTIDQAHYRTLRSPAGPVHLNFMFREPLAPAPTGQPVRTDHPALQHWLASDRAFTHYATPEATVPQKTIAQLSQMLAERQGLLVVGQLRDAAEREAVRKLAAKLGWPVFADITSNLRTGKRLPTCAALHDLLLRAAKITADFQPELVLQIGSRLTSKRLLAFLRDLHSENYIMLAPHPFRHDPDHRVTWRLEGDIAQTCQKLAKKQSKSRAKMPTIVELSKRLERKLGGYFDSQKNISEPAIAHTIARLAPASSALFLASSMPVRDMDLFALPDGPTLRVAANRGASGIDGTIASAAGYASGLRTPTTLLIGDLAFLHDLNSLQQLKALQTPLVMVVINNDGGGIFSFLPIAEHKAHFEHFFGTPHGLTFRSAAELFGLHYENPQNLAEFRKVYRQAFRRKTATIIEVKTERAENLTLHRSIEKLALAEIENG